MNVPVVQMRPALACGNTRGENRARDGGLASKKVSDAAILAIAALALAGCTTTRYVTVPCVTDQQYQKLKDAEPPKIHDKLTGKANEDIRPIAGSAVRLRSWGTGLLGVLEGCRGPR
jgi:hypothetical protein